MCTWPWNAAAVPYVRVRVPASSCVPCVPETQGSSAPGGGGLLYVRRMRTSLNCVPSTVAPQAAAALLRNCPEGQWELTRTLTLMLTLTLTLTLTLP